MKFDITFGPFIGDSRKIVELAVQAEHLGYDTAWITHDPLCDNSWVICGSVGLATNRIRVGPAIVNPYSSSLVEIAMGVATLDNITGGRAVLGFGPGSKKMLEESGLKHFNLMKTMEHSINYLKNMLSPSASALKQKLQKTIPIYFGCQSPKLLEHIGIWQIGGLVLLTPPAYGAEALNLIHQGASKTGKQVLKSEIAASILCSIDKDENNAKKAFASFIINIIDYLSPHQLNTVPLTTNEIEIIKNEYREAGWEALPEKIYRLGAVGMEDCIRTVEMLKTVGFERIKVGSPLGPHKEEAIRLFALDVIPHFK